MATLSRKPPTDLTEDILLHALSILDQHGGNQVAAAAALGLNRKTFVDWVRKARQQGIGDKPKFSVPQLPDEELPIEDLLAHRRKTSARKLLAAHARKLIPITLNERGPIGLTVFGDLHIDDDGCHWERLDKDMETVNKTEGMFCGSIGDLQNGWVGRLSRKWADQSTTGKQAWKLGEWWIDTMSGKLLFLVEGNHDAWCKGVNGISPISWVMNYHPGVTDADGIRFKLILPEGDPIIINARHDFAGRSQYNAAHGPLKAAMFGFRDDDVLIAGHTHVSGYSPVLNPATGKVTHPVRVASYKAVDDYAKERGFLDGNISESVVIMIDPFEPDIRHRVWIEFSVSRAAKILTMLRKEWKKRAA